MTVSVTSSCCEGRELTQVREEILVSRSGSVLWSVLSVQFSVSAHQSSQTSSVYPLSTGRGQLETVRPSERLRSQSVLDTLGYIREHDGPHQVSHSGGWYLLISCHFLTFPSLTWSISRRSPASDPRGRCQYLGQ